MTAADELWSPKLSVGVEQIDDHHRALIRLLLECRDAAGSGRGRDEIKDILSAFSSDPGAFRREHSSSSRSGSSGTSPARTR